MTRQAMFRDDGTLTDIPTKIGENPQLEKQLLLNLVERPLVNPHATALAQDKQIRAQQRYDKGHSQAKPIGSDMTTYIYIRPDDGKCVHSNACGPYIGQEYEHEEQDWQPPEDWPYKIRDLRKEVNA